MDSKPPPPVPDTASQDGPLAILLAEYAHRREELLELDRQIVTNYGWVLSSLVGFLGATVAAGQWMPSIVQAITANPVWLLVLALALLWFAAFDATRWIDMRMAVEYINEVVEPELAGSLKSEGVKIASWNDFRAARLAKHWWGTWPVHTTRMALPYLPTLSVVWTAFYISTEQTRGGLFWLMAVACALGVVLVAVGLLRAGLLTPARQGSL